MTLFITLIIGSFIVASVAHSKGKSAGGWFFYAIFLFPIALIHVLVARPNTAAVEAA